MRILKFKKNVPTKLDEVYWVYKMQQKKNGGRRLRKILKDIWK